MYELSRRGDREIEAYLREVVYKDLPVLSYPWTQMGAEVTPFGVRQFRQTGEKGLSDADTGTAQGDSAGDEYEGQADAAL